MNNPWRLAGKWYNKGGKVLLFKFQLLLLFGLVVARQIPSLQDRMPEERFLLLLVSPLLLMQLEILMELGTNGTTTDLELSRAALDKVSAKLYKAKSLDIAASSTESIYLELRDSLLMCRSLSCRILLRCPAQGDTYQMAKLQRNEKEWKSLEEVNNLLNVDIRYSKTNTILRSIILNRDEAYLGFYKWDGKRYWGHNVPFMYGRVGTVFGDHIVDISLNTFESLWAHSEPQPSYR